MARITRRPNLGLAWAFGSLAECVASAEQAG